MTDPGRPIACNDEQAGTFEIGRLIEAGVCSMLPSDPIDTIRFYELWERFFGQEDKYAFAAADDRITGYFPVSTEKAIGAREADNKEFFQVSRGMKLPEYLDASTWAIFESLRTLAQSILRRTAAAATLPHIADMLSDPSRMIMRIAHYPGGPVQAGAAAAPHTDIDLMTLLPEATEPGLMVEDAAGTWQAVAPRSGEVLVLAGDMLQVASRGRLRAVRHRVDRSIGPRLSISFFANPPDHELLSHDVTAGELFLQRMRAMK